MKLEPNMYVRTDNGIIGKIYEQIGDMFTYKDNNRDYITYGLSHNEILKSSYNIIDLIEEGDFVNGYPVVDFDVTYFNGIDRREEPKRIGVIVEKNMGFSKTYFKNEDIKTILTKEQYENNCYRIEE